MGASASTIMHEKLSPEAEKVLKTQYESLKKEGKTNPDEIGDAFWTLD